MADEIRPVEYYSITVGNKPGEAARILELLRQAGVNLIGFWGYPTGKKSAVLDLVPENAGTMASAARKAKIKAGPKKQGFYINGQDRTGAVADVLSKLGTAGINVFACQAICGGEGRYGFFLEFEGTELRKARKILSTRRAPEPVSEPVAQPKTQPAAETLPAEPPA
jgi:prephenate dehydratase